MRPFAAAVLTLCVACGAFRKEIDPLDDESTVITVEVVNHNALDMTIYTVRMGARDRLGQVTAATRASFRVRLRQLGAGGDLQLFADPIGSPRGVTSQVLHMVAGQTAEWALESDLRRSFLSVRE